MKLFDHYIAKNILQSMGLVMFILIALFTFFGFLEEMDSVGRGRYEFTDAILYILLTLPGLISQLIPMAALLGCVIGLGILANNSELIAIRSAGVSLSRLIWSVMKVSILLVILGLIIGEWLAPATDRFAKTFRSVAISNQMSMEGKQGLWAKDGTEIINVRRVLPGARLGEIFIYDINDKYELTSLRHAVSASHRNGNWMLENVTRNDISAEKVTTQKYTELAWPTSISPDLLSVVTIEPRTLSIVGLFQYIDYLESNGLTTDVYEQALWSKLVLPFITIVMMLLAIPFVFGSLRSAGIGSRILVGALIGISFHLLNQMASYLGLVFHVTPGITATLPALLAFAAAVVMIRHVR